MRKPLFLYQSLMPLGIAPFASGSQQGPPRSEAVVPLREAERGKAGRLGAQRHRGCFLILPEHPLQLSRAHTLAQGQHGQQAGFFGAHIVGDDPVVLVIGLLGIAQHKAVGYA